VVAIGIVNPSCLMPSIFERLAQLTGDRMWSRLADPSVALVRQVTDDGRLLPPDWARLQDSKLVPGADASGTEGAAQYGPDAQRVPLWFAHACTQQGRDLAGRWWSILKPDVDPTGDPVRRHVDLDARQLATERRHAMRYLSGSHCVDVRRGVHGGPVVLTRTPREDDSSWLIGFASAGPGA
jgi:hypothetical protein